MPELVSCSQCGKQLRIPDHLMGKTVKCPACQTAFTAAVAGYDLAPVTVEPVAPPRPRPRDPEAPPGPAPRRRREFDEDDDHDREPRRRKRAKPPHRGGVILAMGI